MEWWGILRDILAVTRISSQERFVQLALTEMESSYFGSRRSKSNQFFTAQSNNIEVRNGWRRLCATDCNGTMQNVDDPNKTHKCYLNNNNSYHNVEETFFQNKELKNPNFSYEPSASMGLTFNKSIYHKVDANKLDMLEKVNGNKVCTSSEKTKQDIGLSQENTSHKNIYKKSGNSELSYFSDKFSLGLSSNYKDDDDFQEYKPKKFILFPEKSSSSPSVMDGFSSYFSKNNSRPRCLSDPQSITSTSSSGNCKDDHSSDSHLTTRSRLSSLPNKQNLYSLEADNLMKHDTGSIGLKNILSAESHLEFKQLETSNGVSLSPPICEILPKTSFEICSELSFYQDEHATKNGSELSYFNREKEAKESNCLDADMFSAGVVTSRMIQNHRVPFGKSSDIYSFQFKMHNNVPFKNQPSVYYSIEAGRLSYGWTDVLEKFQSLALKKKEEDFFHKFSNRSYEESRKKKTYQNNSKEVIECKFCKSNLETQQIYKSHTLKQKFGKRTLVTCPILRKLTCERCGATGDNAHTLSYCPLVINENGSKPISVAAELKKTRRFASGKMRKSFY